MFVQVKLARDPLLITSLAHCFLEMRLMPIADLKSQLAAEIEYTPHHSATSESVQDRQATKTLFSLVECYY